MGRATLPDATGECGQTPVDRCLWHGVAALLIAVALAVALQTAHGLSWPYDGDHFRDIAQAQTTRDGHPLSDPFYAGEWTWYNPLVPWVLAAAARVTGLAPATLHVQGGPWLNLLGPIAFLLVCVRLAGRTAGCISVALLLFWNCRTDPSLVCATYSPWLFVATFAQGLFFLSVLALDHAARAGTARSATAAGLMAGLTFLAHTAPALVLGLMALALLGRRQLAVAGVVALAIASPFLLSIVVHYRLHVVNAVPLAWA